MELTFKNVDQMCIDFEKKLFGLAKKAVELARVLIFFGDMVDLLLYRITQRWLSKCYKLLNAKKQMMKFFLRN